MKRFFGMVSREEISSVVSDLEEFSKETPPHDSVASIYVLKNDLEQLVQETPARHLLYDRQFSVPGDFGYTLRKRYETFEKVGPREWLSQSIAAAVRWWRGQDAADFRDRCDQYFFEVVVPEIQSSFGSIAGAMMNTVNEAVINYAEYSFARRSLRRRLQLHLFKTEGDLGYAIVRPVGSRLRTFDPLSLKIKGARNLREARRGWGHTIMMGRALFISFDHEPRRRGMMIIVGPQDPRDGASQTSASQESIS